MKKNLTSHLTGNLGLKIVSVLLAFIVWFIVVNVDDPVQRRTFDNIEVKILNGAYVEDNRNMTYRVEDNKNVINVTVRAKRSVLERISASDISATADLTQIIDFKATPALVPITVACRGVSDDAILSSKQNMEIIMEDLSSAEFIITPTAGDTSPGKGYEVGEMLVSPEKVTITGPESTIGKIDKVIAPIDVTDITSSQSLPSTLRIMDKNADDMSETQTKYLRYNTSNPTVQVQVNLWTIRSNIKIKANYSGNPASGYRITDVSTTPETVSVAGTEEALQALADHGNVIEIPGTEVVADGETEDFERKVDLTKYLPEDTKLATDENTSVLVQLKILPLGSKEYEVATKDIKVSDKGKGLGIVYTTDKIAIRVKGLDSDLESLKSTDIQASITLSGRTAGEDYDIPVTIKLPEGYELVAPVSVALRLDKTDENNS